MYQIKRDSWHYQLYRGWNNHTPHDLCSYVKGLIRAVTVLTLITLLLAALLSPVGFAVADWAYGISIADSMFIGPVLLVLLVLAFFVAGPLIERAYQQLRSWDRMIYYRQREPNFLAKWWQGRKEKICFRVEIKD